MGSVLKGINEGLHQAFAEDEGVYLIGEDLLDPYGGAFKVSAGLSTKYTDRVLSSPVSEAAIVGIAGGMALRGLRPVVEIMFGDFTTLIADQVINSLSKFGWMYNDQVDVPIVIRTPMGGRRGYGPTHSQSLEKLFLGIPGLRVLAPNAIGDPGELLKDAILKDNNPVFFVEHKLLYSREIGDTKSLKDFDVKSNRDKGEYAPSHSLSLKGAPKAKITFTAYGYMAELAREAMLRLAFEEEIFAELVVPSLLSPLTSREGLGEMLLESIKETGKLITIEEGTLSFGWGAEVTSRAAQILGDGLKSVRRVAAKDQVIPASIQLEEEMLPSIEDIMASAREMV